MTPPLRGLVQFLIPFWVGAIDLNLDQPFVHSSPPPQKNRLFFKRFTKNQTQSILARMMGGCN